ncbi:hypothetical protein Tco_0425156 [Tanacetum coccineum]
MSTQQDINAFRAQRIANTHDPLALMANTQTPCHPDHSSLITYIQHPQPNNNFVPQPSFNRNYMPQPMQNLEDSSDPDITQIAQRHMNTSQDIKMQMVDDSVGNSERNKMFVHIMGNSGWAKCGHNPVLHTVEEKGHTALHSKAKKTLCCISSATSCRFAPRGRSRDQSTQQASLSGTQSDNAPVYDSDGSTEEKEYAVLWNNWYQIVENAKMTRFRMIKAYNDMQQKIERLQAQLGDLKGKSCDTQCASNTLDPLFQKLEDEKVSLESQVLNYAKENALLRQHTKIFLTLSK